MGFWMLLKQTAERDYAVDADGFIHSLNLDGAARYCYIRVQ
jgi:hypothetical protein